MGEKANQKAARQSERLQHELLVAYRTVDGFITDWAVNISRGGMFINTRKPLTVGTDVRILVQLPGKEFPYELQGRVTRVTEYDNHANMVPGMGVEFTSVDEGRRREIDAFVDKLRRDLEEA